MAASRLQLFNEENPHRDGTPEFWGKAPQSSCNDPHLTHSDRTVLSVLSFLARATHPYVLATQEDVATRAGMKVRNLQLCYKRLETAGWIERQKGPRNWCTPAQITLLFELRGFQLTNDSSSPRTVHKRTKAQSIAPTEAQSSAPTKAQSIAPTEAQSSAPTLCINKKANSRSVFRRRGDSPPAPPSQQSSFFDRQREWISQQAAYHSTVEFQKDMGWLDDEGGEL